MERKICVFCNTEKRIDNFYNKYRKCKQCNNERSSKCYYKNKDKLSNQREKCYEGKRNVLLAECRVNKQNRKSHTKK